MTTACEIVNTVGKNLGPFCKIDNVGGGPGIPIGVSLPYFAYTFNFFYQSTLTPTLCLPGGITVQNFYNSIVDTNALKHLYAILRLTAESKSFCGEPFGTEFNLQSTVQTPKYSAEDFFPQVYNLMHRDAEIQLQYFNDTVDLINSLNVQNIVLLQGGFINEAAADTWLNNLRTYLDNDFLPNSWDLRGQLHYNLQVDSSVILNLHWDCNGLWANRSLNSFITFTMDWTVTKIGYAGGTISFTAYPTGASYTTVPMLTVLNAQWTQSGGVYGSNVTDLCDLPVGATALNYFIPKYILDTFNQSYIRDLYIKDYQSKATTDGHFQYNLDQSITVLDGNNVNPALTKICAVPQPPFIFSFPEINGCMPYNIGFPPAITVYPRILTNIPYLRLLPTSILLRTGAIAPIYPTFVGSYLYDTMLKKWGKMKQTYKQLLDFSPINNISSQVYPHDIFGIQAALFDTAGKIKVFDEQPAESEICYGKIGLFRHGMTSVEEFITQHKLPFTGTVELQGSLDGKTLDPSLTQSENFTNQVTSRSTFTAVGRWFIIKIKGIWDLCYAEFRGYKVGRR